MFVVGGFIEELTGGWGLNGYFFRLAWVWENGAAAFEVSSGNQEWAPVPDKSAAGGSIDAKAWRDAWQSSEACAAACRGWEACMMWEYVEDLCKMDDDLRMGQGYAPGMTERKTSLMHTSGWIIDRVDEWVC